MLIGPEATTSVFFDYQGHRITEKEDDGDKDRLTDHIFRLGFKVRFGADNLRQADLQGLGLEAPDIGLWVASTPAVD